MKLRIFIFSVCASILIFGAANVYAAGPRIFLDGKEVDYSQIQDETGIVTLPQIIKSRAMVPVRQTAVLLGIQIVYDSASGLITMTKDGVTSTHFVRSQVVTINGVSKTYDAPSAIVDNKTLMPNIMIADIINCDTWWDAATGFTMMRSRPKPVTKPEVITAAVSKPQVMAGTELQIVVTANNNTTRVRLTNSSGQELASASNYAQIGSYRSFTVRYNPQTESPHSQYRVIAGDSASFSAEAYKTVNFTVTRGIDVISASASVSSPYLNDTVKFTVTTTGGVSGVRLTDTSTNKVYDMSNYTVTGSNQDQVFTTDVKMTEKGSKTFSVSVAGSGSSYANSDWTVALTVQERPKDTLAIKDITYDKTRSYSVYDYIDVTVTTSLSTVELEVYDAQSYQTYDRTTYSNPTSTSSDSKKFTARVRLNYNGQNTFVFEAYDENDRKVTREERISTGYNNNTGTGTLIQNIGTPERSGTNYIITVRTRGSVTYVIAQDNGYYFNPNYNPQTYPVNFYTTESNGDKIWTVTVPDPYYNNTGSYYTDVLITAWDTTSNPDERTVRVGY